MAFIYTKIQVLPATNKTITVTFDSDGGSTIPAITVGDGVKFSVIKPTDPTKENYTFAGWFYDDNLTLAIGDNDIMDISITAYAKWE